MFDMPNITTSIPSPIPGSSANHGVGIGGTTTHYLVHQFESGHIPPSTPFVNGFLPPLGAF